MENGQQKTIKGEAIQNANLLSLQDYLEMRHGPAIAQIVIDDLIFAEDVSKAA